MSSKLPPEGLSDPFPEDDLEGFHSPEPWKQDGRYVRDASGAIVVRGRSFADARRIVAAINATREIPTDALEHWRQNGGKIAVESSAGAGTRFEAVIPIEA